VDVEKHVKFNTRGLVLLGDWAIGNDLNRMALGFFLLNALDILGQLTTTSADDRQNWINWIYNCQVQTGGFRGSPATKTGKESIYDTVHLPATYFAIASLLILGDDLKRVNRDGALEMLRNSQNENGSFSPVLLGGVDKFGEVDVRHIYSACAVRELLSPVKPEEDFNVPATIRYIEQCKVFLF